MKRKLSGKVGVCIGIVCGLWIQSSYGGQEIRLTSPPAVDIFRGSEEIRIDGMLNDPPWRTAPVLRLVDNATGKRPGQWTRARLVWSDTWLYAAFDCQDRSPEATLTQRDDNLWREDAVEIFLDPAGDGREYLEIEVNPIGALYDGWVHYSPNIDFDKSKSFDLKHIRVAAHIDSGKGWTCEMAIPLDELPVRITRSPRINLTRIDRMDGKHVYQAWSPTYRWFHVPERFGRVFLRRRGERHPR